MEAKGLSKFTVRTSDRRVFRRCLRKWNFQSSMRQNLEREGTEQNINFWFGTAIHFCLEDYHGENRFKDPRRAFHAYYNAFKEEDRPSGADAHYALGLGMLTYYIPWMERHNQATGFKTVYHMPDSYEPVPEGTPGAIPADEIQFILSLDTWAIVDIEEDRIVGSFTNVSEAPPDWDPTAPEKEYLYEGRRVTILEIFYHGTIDRIVQDAYGRYWLWDYKTAKKADTGKLDTDDQVSAYLWAASKLFPFPVYGFVYLQLTKALAEEPKRLKDGALSCDKRQSTTHALYRAALIHDYGEVNKAPSKMIATLNHFATLEEPEGDKYIRWDFVKRNKAQLEATEAAIRAELRLMLDPNLGCFPSPTRDCSWDCPFREACIAMDRGDEDGYREFMLDYQQRPHGEDGNRDPWRENIKWPTCDEDLVPMEEILNYAELGFPEFKAEEIAEEGFQFLFEKH